MSEDILKKDYVAAMRYIALVNFESLMELLFAFREGRPVNAGVDRKVLSDFYLCDAETGRLDPDTHETIKYFTEEMPFVDVVGGGEQDFPNIVI